ncbi:MAG: hypothetical protein GWP15_04015 [Nitrospirae bacterium]|nr:hypothetical protein [Nitrospirota bacterium]
MVEDTKTQTDPATGGGATGGATGATVVSGDGIVIDKNKAQEQYVKEAEEKYIIPALVREKFPDLVKLIYETESMNNEEREYWMQIMPIMTEEQIVKFREILVNEKDQLAKLDNEYEQEVGRINAPAPEIDEEKLKKKMAEIEKKEKVDEEAEKVKEKELLKQLEGL